MSRQTLLTPCGPPTVTAGVFTVGRGAADLCAAGVGEPGADAAAGADVAAMSAARTAPPGPEPRTRPTSMPRSAASRRAFGDAAVSRADVASPTRAGAVVSATRAVAPLPAGDFRLSTYAST